MKIACFIPIKAYSERISGKNFRVLNGKKLYQYICEHALEADIFDDIFVDTNSEEIAGYALKTGLSLIKRTPELALDSANGNDLLNHHMELFPDYDFYFQLFATAPYLQPETIRKCVKQLVNSQSADSIFTATANYSFYWLNKNPLNYQPAILPRSQDLEPVMEETTGLYGIAVDALHRYRCRVGCNPIIFQVGKFEAVDINTEEDFKVAEYIGKAIYGL